MSHHSDDHMAGRSERQSDRVERETDRVERRDDRLVDNAEMKERWKDPRQERLDDRAESKQQRLDDRVETDEQWTKFLRDQDDRLITLHGPIITGLAKFKRNVYIGLAIAMIGVFGALAGMRYQSYEVGKVSESNREILVRMAAQNEANCKARDTQLRAAAESNAVGRKFFLDLGKKLAAEGSPQSGKFIEETLRAIAPVPTPAKANCDFSETLNGG